MKKKPFCGDESSLDVFATELNGLVLLKADLKFDELGTPSFLNRVTEGNLCMCESNIPLIIIEIAKQLLVDNRTVLIGELKGLVKHDFLDHRLTQLLNDVLYTNFQFDHLWNGEHDYRKVYSYTRIGSNTTVYYSVYERAELFKLLFVKGVAQLKKGKRSAQLRFCIPERSIIAQCSLSDNFRK